MAMTNAERQKQYRERMKAEGKMRIVSWAEKGGGLAATEKGGWPTITKAQLDGAIRKGLVAFDGEETGWLKEVVYAELAAHLPGIIKRFQRYIVTQ